MGTRYFPYTSDDAWDYTVKLRKKGEKPQIYTVVKW